MTTINSIPPDSEAAADWHVPAPSRWDELPSCSGPCEVCPDDDKGPVWFQFTERHPLIVAIAAVGLGMCTVLWD